jgi:hypothetical protein
MPKTTEIHRGDRFVSLSGRRWEASPTRYDCEGYVMLTPLGWGVHSGGGGVKCRQVEVERLVKETHGWRRA